MRVSWFTQLATSGTDKNWDLGFRVEGLISRVWGLRFGDKV